MTSETDFPGAKGSRNDSSQPQSSRTRWWKFSASADSESDSVKDWTRNYRPRSTLGVLSDKETDEVPGTVLLLASNRNEPLGLRHQPRRTSASSLPSQLPSRSSSHSAAPVPQKRTPDGQVVLNPQPEDSLNDPLNWPVWRRDAALFSLGCYCMIGGGMTTILAAGFNEIAADYEVSTQEVAYTTGLYMTGLGLGSIIMAPTAILFGKRPIYLLGASLFILSAVWCALSPNYPSLVLARIFQGIAVSPVECLPSATIAEIFFLHERAYRVGIYTLLLLGGKNLVPLLSAAIIQSRGWRWVFWVVAMIVSGCLGLLFFFVPETFWDRRPRPRARSKHPDPQRGSSDPRGRSPGPSQSEKPCSERSPVTPKRNKAAHVEFTNPVPPEKAIDIGGKAIVPPSSPLTIEEPPPENPSVPPGPPLGAPAQPTVLHRDDGNHEISHPTLENVEAAGGAERTASMDVSALYTHRLRERPPVPFVQTLKLWTGRLVHDRWMRVAVRPFVLYTYPAVLWSAMVYALSVGWLIVLSESVARIYQGQAQYNFSPLATGLVYLSPFLGGILGTAVAGRVSDIVVRWMTRHNGGIYEPEFRLVMAAPVAVFTATGLIGFGWSAQVRDAWIVPTVFFGLLSFGCTLGSTTAITFCVDSYRQYAGEALVTLNVSKNILHGLVFSLFFVHWLDADGPRPVFLAIGCIHLALLALSVPMYIWGKRARMWTVRKNLMERF